MTQQDKGKLFEEMINILIEEDLKDEEFISMNEIIKLLAYFSDYTESEIRNGLNSINSKYRPNNNIAVRYGKLFNRNNHQLQFKKLMRKKFTGIVSQYGVSNVCEVLYDFFYQRGELK